MTPTYEVHRNIPFSASRFRTAEKQLMTTISFSESRFRSSEAIRATSLEPRNGHVPLMLDGAMSVVTELDLFLAKYLSARTAFSSYLTDAEQQQLTNLIPQTIGQ